MLHPVGSDQKMIMPDNITMYNLKYFIFIGSVIVNHQHGVITIQQ